MATLVNCEGDVCGVCSELRDTTTGQILREGNTWDPCPHPNGFHRIEVRVCHHRDAAEPSSRCPTCSRLVSRGPAYLSA
jgi:hypothetical protein